MDSFEAYFHQLKETPPENITEFSHRGKLETLLNELAPKTIKVLMEPRRERGIGAPDFQISSRGLILGYVENKALDGEPLDKTLKGDQLKKYQQLSGNILLTNYIEWILVRDGKPVMRESLCYRYDLENKKSKLSKERVQAVALLIQKFFDAQPEVISSAKKLAEALAIRAKMLKGYLLEELIRQEKEHQEGRLYELYKSFRDYVFHELELEQFADAFTQNLVYGLFLARLNADTKEKEINLYNAIKYIPTSFELIKELVDFLKELDKEEYLAARWIVEEVISIINNLDLPSINRSLFYRISKNKNLFNETEISYRDPFVYFYEYFLGVYDKNLRKSKGVYYTPPPIVHFIVNAVQHVLKNTFRFHEGLADERVTVLDFATGTGTFLLEIFEQIFESIPKNAGNREQLIKERLQKNMYGFEYLIAPYTVAHLKLSQYLKENGYSLQPNERLHIYLTNTLEPADLVTQQIPFLPALTQEGRNAQVIKNKHVLVITGNPPYSGISKNKGEWISNLIEDYKKLEGGEWKERKHWLGDDYVKFIRFAQHKMECETVWDEKAQAYKDISNEKDGIVAIITNHSFLDNPTFNGMRQSLLKTFDELYFLNLHGNYNQNEKTPDGGKDENVFDQIRQGVSINIFVKKKGSPKKVYYADWWGEREEKYKLAWESSFKEVNWQELKPNFPFYFFVPKSELNREEYEKYWKIDEIFKEQVTGIITSRDSFAIGFSKKEVEDNIKKFIDFKFSDDDVRNELKLRDTRSWKLGPMRRVMSGLDNRDANFEKIHYRPFDKRDIFYHDSAVDWGRWEYVKHLLKGENIGLISMRQYAYDVLDYCYSFVSKDMIDNRTFISNKGTASLFPLFLYEKTNGKEDKKVNFTPAFFNYLKEQYNDQSPEQMLGYIYAILYSPSYRKKYAEFLKSDFPRIPFTADKNLFDVLSDLGAELIALHIAENEGDEWQGHSRSEFDIFITKQSDKQQVGSYIGSGKGNKVDEVRFELLKEHDMPEKILQQLMPYEKHWGRVYISKNKYFNLVPLSVWHMQIGGYQVLEKWLKDRKGRELSAAEIKHYPQVIKTLCTTQHLMKQIDSFTAQWI
ncbi:MAG TPA: N-6 DNA methylase [Ferruginibacter sp.]|nr:hypothetical protein [Chitinophagaceae bacterium]HRI24090.1 N-6 DNA methylase [Ferruginibacter sp.]